MDKTCVVINRLIDWVNRIKTFPVIYCGTGSSYQSAPAPYMEITYMQSGHAPDLHLGSMVAAIPEHHIAVHNLHFGCISKNNHTHKGWCVIFDVRNAKELGKFMDSPFLYTIPMPDAVETVSIFKQLQRYGLQAGWANVGYPPPVNFFEKRSKKDLLLSESTLINSTFLQLLAMMLFEKENIDAGSKSPIPEEMLSSLEFIEENYVRPQITQTDIAASANLSSDHFGRQFKRYFNITPMHMLRKIRLQHAAAMLQYTIKRIESIARSVGFSDPYHFSRVFKSEFGISPREYRIKNTGKSV
jgi:AraC-like DNA-binding protein